MGSHGDSMTKGGYHDAMRGYHDATRELPCDMMGGATTARQGSYHDPLSVCGRLLFLVFSFVVILSVVQRNIYLLASNKRL
jgi:hypothetical protein